MGIPTGELAALGAALIWACTALVFTSAGRSISPVAVNAYKTVAAALLFVAVIWLTQGRPFPRGVAPSDAARLAASGLIGLTWGDSLLFQSFQLIGTRRAMLVYALNPVMGALGGIAFLGERPDARAVAGMALALGGVAWVIGERREAIIPAGGESVAGVGGRVKLGVLLGLGSALGQAVGALLAKPALARVSTIPATSIRVGGGAVGLILLGMLGGRLVPWIRMFRGRRLLASMTVASVFGPFIGISLMVLSLARTSTGVALTLLSTVPIWLLPISHHFQHDRPSLRETVGACVAVGGVALLVWRAA